MNDSIVLLFWHGLRFKSKRTELIQGGIAMDNREMEGSGQAIALAFLGGAVAGVIAGLIVAPKSGGRIAWDIEGIRQDSPGKYSGGGEGGASRP